MQHSTIKVVALAGSLSPDSTSLAAARVALEAARAAGASVEVLDLRALQLPMYDPEATEVPEAVKRLVEAVASADGLIWASPLYHGTISGAFKNALDWLQLLGDAEPAYLTDKVVGLVATAGGTQAVQAINTMEYVVRALRGWTVPLTVPVNRAWQAFGDGGRVQDAEVAERLAALGREVATAAGRLKRPAAVA